MKNSVKPKKLSNETGRLELKNENLQVKFLMLYYSWGITKCLKSE